MKPGPGSINSNSFSDTIAANSDTQLTKNLRLHKNLKRSAKFSVGVSGFQFRFRFRLSSARLGLYLCDFECMYVCEPEMEPIACCEKVVENLLLIQLHS